MARPRPLKDHPRISIDPGIMGGSPCIKGTRVPLYVILDNLEAGHNFEDIIEHYPTLTRGDIQAAIRFSSHLTSELVHAHRPR